MAENRQGCTPAQQSMCSSNPLAFTWHFSVVAAELLISRHAPCHKHLFLVQKFHGLVVPFGTSGMVQVGRPLVLVPLVSRRSEDTLLLVPLVPRRSEDPLLLVPLVPRTPTCPNLSHLVVPLVLSQLSFLRFFLGFSLPFHFSKNTFE